MEDSNNAAEALLEDTTINCYLHNISEVKNATGSQKKYFNCIVQGSDKPVRAIYFSPEKLPKLQAIATTKSPIKLKNYKRKSAFPIWKSLSAAANPVKISSVPNLASEQLIFVKAKVLKISGVKILSTRFGKLKKQDVIVADTTAHIKLVLWCDHVNSLQQDKTYQLKNVRIKSTKYKCYLNTPRNEDFKAF
ncbi:Hypothetical predicted protein [Paramuricea clavata]|uniref:Uncharacterized protein n=1 Tax=Paramuricea clavata TaxID=317549 RepID=A0A6S7FH39_PARCT|nr:Hypothetical predicted protein [Paramuricea clavata]